MKMTHPYSTEAVTTIEEDDKMLFMVGCGRIIESRHEVLQRMWNADNPSVGCGREAGALRLYLVQDNALQKPSSIGELRRMLGQ
jgi:hypothetical protein